MLSSPPYGALCTKYRALIAELCYIYIYIYIRTKREVSSNLFVFSACFGKLSLLQENDDVLNSLIIVYNLMDTTSK